MFGAEILSETYPLYTQQWYMQYWNFSVTNTIAVCTVKNSWWWTEELFETCRVLFQNKFEKLVHLVGFIIGIYRDGRSYKCQVYIYIYLFIYIRLVIDLDGWNARTLQVVFDFKVQPLCMVFLISSALTQGLYHVWITQPCRNIEDYLILINILSLCEILQ